MQAGRTEFAGTLAEPARNLSTPPLSKVRDFQWQFVALVRLHLGQVHYSRTGDSLGTDIISPKELINIPHYPLCPVDRSSDHRFLSRPARSSNESSVF